MIRTPSIGILTICHVELQISVEEEEVFFPTKLYRKIPVVAQVITISIWGVVVGDKTRS